MTVLECAYDAGIRHFDVARMYGGGEAERCVGDFARRYRDKITIATKLGISPGSKDRIRNTARAILHPIIRLIPRLKPSQHIVSRLSPPARIRTSFALKDAEESLNASLSTLKTDHIDLLLLHEATAADLNDDRLLRFLEDAVTSGRIGAFGVGSDRRNINDLLARQTRYCSVIQCQWSILDELTRWDNCFRIYHGVFRQSLMRYYEELTRDRKRCAKWSETLGFDISQRRIFEKLILKAALIRDANSIILFASASPKHILQNCETAGDSRLDVSAKTLFNLIQSRESSTAAE